MKLIKLLIGSLLVLIVSNVHAEERIFLGDLKPMKIKIGFGSTNEVVIRDGKAPWTGLEFFVDGKPVKKGLCTHADSEIVFSIPAGARRFIAVCTMPNFNRASHDVGGFDVLDGTWAYEVLIDGISVFESEHPLCAYVKKQLPIEVEIPENSRNITLKTYMLGNRHFDHAIWAEPYFIKP